MTLPISQKESHDIENRFEYDGSLKKIAGLHLVNILLSIFTLGIYSFWGRTKLRKYITHSVSLLKERFEYTGTGGELFRGFLLGMLIYIAFLGVFMLLYGFLMPENMHVPLIIVMYVCLLYLLLLALYQSLKYKVSRIIWRGIRGKQTGSPFVFAQEELGRLLLRIVSLGYLSPAMDVKTYTFIIENFSYGSEKASFNGTADPLKKINLITLILCIPTLGFSRFWYHAALVRHQWAHTTLKNLRFKSTVTAGNIIFLFLTNMLIIFLTLGLGYPFVVHRNIAFFTRHTIVLGNIQTSGILDSDEVLGTTGEGLSSAFGLETL